jgi:multicomponent Na+:H+ antiporter subunit G
MNLVSAILFTIGSLFFLLSSAGLFRLPDTLSRMHAASKSSTLGLAFVLGAGAYELATVSVLLKSLLIMALVFLTVPVATHMLAKAAARKD